MYASERIGRSRMLTKRILRIIEYGKKEPLV